MPTPSSLRTLSVVGAVAVALAGAALPVGAASASTASVAMIRGGHFSPNTPGVDVYLTGFGGGTKKLWLSGVSYGDVSAYQPFPAGVYAVSMRPHGAPASTPAALTWTLDARAGSTYTAYAVGMNPHLHGVVLGDDLSMTPAGKTRVRVIQAASRAPRARVALAGGAVLGADVAFGQATGYHLVPAGSQRISVTAVGKPGVNTATNVTLPADSVHTIVVLDAKGGGITVHTLQDGAGASAPPNGAVPAGGGGTAPTTTRGDWVDGTLVAVLGVGVLALGASVAGRRRRWAGRGR
jgi:hypothetical protein